VETVNTRDGIRVRGSNNVPGQSVDFNGATQSATPFFFLSSSLPDQGHRIVYFCEGVGVEDWNETAVCSEFHV
jgi:hypothetical protein